MEMRGGLYALKTYNNKSKWKKGGRDYMFLESGKIHILVGTTGSSERPKEAMWRAVVHRHVKIEVGIGNVVVNRRQVGQRGYIGSGDRLKEEPLLTGKYHLRKKQRRAHNVLSSISGWSLLHPWFLRRVGFRRRTHSLPIIL